MTTNKPVRFFVGHYMSEPRVLEYYRSVTARLERECGVPSLAKTHPLHNTLMGPPNDTTQTDFDTACEILEELAKKMPSYLIDIDGIGYFDMPLESQTAYLNVLSPLPKIVKLAEHVGGLFSRAMPGRIVMRSPYRPHLSIARYLSPEQMRRVVPVLSAQGRVVFRDIKITHIHLFRKHGARYEVDRSFRLRG